MYVGLYSVLSSYLFSFKYWFICLVNVQVETIILVALILYAYAIQKYCLKKFHATEMILVSLYVYTKSTLAEQGQQRWDWTQQVERSV